MNVCRQLPRRGTGGNKPVIFRGRTGLSERPKASRHAGRGARNCHGSATRGDSLQHERAIYRDLFNAAARETHVSRVLNMREAETFFVLSYVVSLLTGTISISSRLIWCNEQDYICS